MVLASQGLGACGDRYAGAGSSSGGMGGKVFRFIDCMRLWQ